jgi:hypothetical protein
VLFIQVPSSRPHHQRGQIGPKSVLFSLRTLVPDRSSNRVPQILLAFNIVAPGRRIRVLEVGHVNIGSRVQRVDDHLAIDRSGDLDATIGEVRGDARDLPILAAQLGRLSEEIGQFAGIERCLALGACVQQRAAPCSSPPMERRHEFKGFCREDARSGCHRGA